MSNPQTLKKLEIADNNALWEPSLCSRDPWDFCAHFQFKSNANSLKAFLKYKRIKVMFPTRPHGSPRRPPG
jgi:hypothetical protein